MIKNNVYEIIFHSPEFETLGEWIGDASGPAFLFLENEEDFLLVKNKKGITNKASILSKFKTIKERKDIEGKNAKNLPIKVGTLLAIPTNKVNKAGLLTQGIEVVSNDTVAFKASILAELERDKGYLPNSKIKMNDGTVATESTPEASIFIWCRALSKSNDINEGKLIDVTPFIDNVTTMVSKKSGGNFSFDLPPLQVIKNADTGDFELKEVYNYYDKNYDTSVGSYYSESNIYDKDEIYFFQEILSANDLVFIRFESLKMEKRFQLNLGRIDGQIYDMIGLIDQVNLSLDYTSNEGNVTVAGRDLIKLMIEDGTYFYALEMSQGILNFAGGSTQRNQYIQRAFSDNALQYFSLYYNNSIEDIFKFVLQQLTMIEIAPTSLFESYGSRLNRRFIDNNFDKSIQGGHSKSTAKSQAIELIKDIRIDRETNLKDVQKEKVKIEELFNKMLDFFTTLEKTNLKKRIKGEKNMSGWNPFSYASEGKIEKIEVDTFPAIFHTELHFVSFYTKKNAEIKGEKDLMLLIENLSQYKEIEGDEEWKDGYAPGIWGIIKLVIDKAVTNRRVVDSSASTSNGPLINFLRKVCQEPFVELYSDTYGDMYHLVVRKPPYDKKSIYSLLGFGEAIGTESSKQYESVIIDIADEDVLNESLNYNGNDTYSWYHLTPQTSFIGNDQTYSLAYLPGIYFEEYAEIWGSKPLQIVHNYMPRLPLGVSEDNDLDISERQAFEDMKYLIESHAYLPFTKEGTIMLNGDRRLKVGNMVRYKGFVYFIDSVKNSYQRTDRHTALQLVRGMDEEFIKPKTIDGVEMSYFNIINTDLILEKVKVIEKVTKRRQIGERTVPKINFNPHSGSSFIPEATDLNNYQQIGELYKAAATMKGYKYSLGATGKGNYIDCSGFVREILRKSGIKSNGGPSEDLMTGSNNFREVSIVDIGSLREGDVVGFDHGKKYKANGVQWDAGRKYGIDHIGIVVYNYNTGIKEMEY